MCLWFSRPNRRDWERRCLFTAHCEWWCLNSQTFVSYIPLWNMVGRPEGISEFEKLERITDISQSNCPLSAIFPLENILELSPRLFLLLGSGCLFLSKATWFISEQLWFLDILSPFQLWWKEKVILGASFALTLSRGFHGPWELPWWFRW